MKIFNIVYLIISVSIVLFQAFVLPKMFCGEYSKEKLCSKIRKFIEQFMSSVVGYGFLYYFIRKVAYAIINTQYDLFNIADILLLIISLMGVSGFLSFVIYKVSGKILEILKPEK
jgi:hydrogenase-4 membrane subunit HyfE